MNIKTTRQKEKGQPAMKNSEQPSLRAYLTNTNKS